MQPIRVLVVDNSIFFRDELADGLMKSLPAGSLVERASAPVEAKDKVRLFRPNVVVANYAMASIQLDGKRFFTMLTDLVNGPVVSFGAVPSGRESALQSGAIDYIVKPAGGDVTEEFFKGCVSRLQFAITRYNLLPLAKTKENNATERAIKPGIIMTRAGWQRANSATNQHKPQALHEANKGVTLVSQPVAPSPKTIVPAVSKTVVPSPVSTHIGINKKIELIAIGSSTGGTEALSVVLKDLRPPLPPIVIVQHIPPLFSRLLSERLDEECVIRVKEAEDGDMTEANTAYIAPGSKHMTISRVGNGMKLTCQPGPRVHSCCPSVDVLFDSVVDNIGGPSVLGVILTGMGHDGAAGLLKMRQVPSVTFLQVIGLIGMSAECIQKNLWRATATELLKVKIKLQNLNWL